LEDSLSPWTHLDDVLEIFVEVLVDRLALILRLREADFRRFGRGLVVWLSSSSLSSGSCRGAGLRFLARVDDAGLIGDE
jgi:hypothetical protein